jgi:VIT1/CCC1 family predicted Fe2+/Mn2+ transporter
MLGLTFGFLLNNPADLSIVTNVCLGAAIALGMSGVSSAYVSEYAERQHALSKLEDAMLLIFLLGVFFGRIAGVSSMRLGLQTLLVATVTAALIYLFAG